MNFFVIPYLLAVDMMIPPLFFESPGWPMFQYNVTVDSTIKLAEYSENSSNFRLTTTMTCWPDSLNLSCRLSETKVFHCQNSTERFSFEANGSENSIFSGITSITNETFNLEFEPDGVKISSCKETSEKSLRMLQKIVDLLHVKVDFDGPRRGASRLETLTMIDDCPVTTIATFEETGKSTRKPGEIFFKIEPYLDELDVTKAWILEVNKTKDIQSCNYNEDYFFGIETDDETKRNRRITYDITSSYSNIAITNEKFVSIGHTEGTVSAGINKFVTNEIITISAGLDWDIFVPIKWALYEDKIANRFS